MGTCCFACSLGLMNVIQLLLNVLRAWWSMEPVLISGFY